MSMLKDTVLRIRIEILSAINDIATEVPDAAIVRLLAVAETLDVLAPSMARIDSIIGDMTKNIEDSKGGEESI